MKYLLDKAAQIAFFAIYTAMLVAVLLGVKTFVLAHVDTSAFMTPTICFFFNQLNVFGLLSMYFSFISANWLKSKVVQFWTRGS